MQSNLKIPHIQHKQVYEEVSYETMVRKFVDMLCANLKDTTQNKLRTCKRREVSTAIDGAIKLERIRGKDESAERLPAENQRIKQRIIVGIVVSENFYACRKSLGAGAHVVHKKITRCCSMFKISLCGEIQKDVKIG